MAQKQYYTKLHMSEVSISGGPSFESPINLLTLGFTQNQCINDLTPLRKVRTNKHGAQKPLLYSNQ